MSSFHREPGIDASYQVSVHLAMRFQRRRFFLNRPIGNNNLVAMLVNGSRQNEHSVEQILHKCALPSFGSFEQAEKIFFIRSIRNKNCLWWPCLLTDQNELCNLYREHKGNNKITELRTILQRESQNS